MPDNTSRANETAMHNLTPRRGAGIALTLLLAGVPLLGACTNQVAEAAKVEAVKVEAIAGSTASRITLTPKATERLGVETAAVTAAPTKTQLQIPSAAVLYDPDGTTFTYTSPQDRVYVRADIRLVRLSNGIAVLAEGPPVGTKVVTVGAAELFGIDTGVGGGH